MKRLIDFLGSGAGVLLLFLLGLLLFSWPLLSITADKGGVAFFRYLFFSWAGLVAALCLMSRAAPRASSRRKEEDP